MQLLCGGPHTGILGGSWPPRAIQLSISGLCYFSPFAVIQAGRTHLSRELLTLCSNQKWPLSLRFFQMDITSPRSPKKSISPLLIVFLFSVGFNCLTAISGLRKERKDCIFNRNWLYLCLFFFLQAPYGWPCFCVCSRLLQAVSSVPTTLWQRVPEVVQRYQSCESLILKQARSDMTLPVPVLVENKSSSREQSNINARWLGCWLLFWFSCSKWSPEMEPPHKGWNFSCCARLHDLCASHLALQFSVARRSFPSYLWKRSYLFFVYI